MPPFFLLSIRAELLLLLLASPLLLFPERTYGLGMLAVPLLWGLRYAATGHFVVSTPLDRPIVLLLAMTGVAQLVSSDAAFSLSKSAGVVLGVGTYYALAAMARSTRTRIVALLLFTAINLGVAGISLFATAWGNKFPLFQPLLTRLPRLIQEIPGSPPEGFNANSVAGIFLFGLPLFLLLALARHQEFEPFWRVKWLVRAGAVVSALGIMLLFAATQSRAGYVSLALALAALPLLPRPRWLAGAVAAGGVALLLLWASPLRAPLVVALTPGAEGGVTSLSSVSGRFLLWERAIAAIGDFPFTGVGLGMFRFVQPRLYPLNTVPPQTDIGHAHNHFLQMGVDVGIPGLLAYIALWWGALWMGFSHLWRREAGFWVMLGLLAGLLGYFLWATLETHALGSKAGWFFWWSLGLIAMTRLRAGEQHG